MGGALLKFHPQAAVASGKRITNTGVFMALTTGTYAIFKTTEGTITVRLFPKSHRSR